MGFDLDHPKNLADWKVMHGDASDNLPPGSPKCLFDLCEPHTEFIIENAAPWYNELVECLENPEANIKKDHFDQTIKQFALIGLNPPVRL
jgi:hypothetical protein